MVVIYELGRLESAHSPTFCALRYPGSVASVSDRASRHSLRGTSPIKLWSDISWGHSCPADLSHYPVRTIRCQSTRIAGSITRIVISSSFSFFCPANIYTVSLKATRSTTHLLDRSCCRFIPYPVRYLSNPSSRLRCCPCVLLWHWFMDRCSLGLNPRPSASDNRGRRYGRFPGIYPYIIDLICLS